MANEGIKNVFNNPPQSPITPDQFQEILPKICDSRTTLDANGWTPDNPLYGHCAVVSAVANNLFGGKILRASLENTPFAHMRSHYINQLPNGNKHDFTKPQFKGIYPQGLKFEERSIEYILKYPDTATRYRELTIRLAREITQNPLFDDEIYLRCLDNALQSPCQKMHFGAVITRNGLVVAESGNLKIKELEHLCDPVCIRHNIDSRRESMLGACGHAEELAIAQIIEKGINPRECELYIAGMKINGMPYIKEKPEHTCLRCAVQMNNMGIKMIYMPVKDQWQGQTTSDALTSASLYATGINKA